jgi:hypothetical protein
MMRALVQAVEHPPAPRTVRLVAVEDIRRATSFDQEVISV